MPFKPKTESWITPYLCVKNAEAALEYDKKVFGFAQLFVHKQDGKIMHAEIASLRRKRDELPLIASHSGGSSGSRFFIGIISLRVKWAKTAGRVAVLLLGVALILFPDVPRAFRQIAHLADPESLIEPNHPAIVELSRQLETEIPSTLPPGEQLQRLQKFIYARIPYCHDWVQWWNVDYWPTASEVLAAGREDCDGRAVLTASLLRHRGFQARLVGNPRHIWVAVDLPGAAVETLEPATDKSFGSDRGWSLPRLSTLLEGFRYSLVKFPMIRSALLAAWCAVVLAWPSPRRMGFAVVIVLAALGLLVGAAHAAVTPVFGLALAAVLLPAGSALRYVCFRKPQPNPPSLE